MHDHASIIHTSFGGTVAFATASWFLNLTEVAQFIAAAMAIVSGTISVITWYKNRKGSGSGPQDGR